MGTGSPAAVIWSSLETIPDLELVFPLQSSVNVLSFQSELGLSLFFIYI